VRRGAKGNPAKLIKRKDCPQPAGCPLPTRCCDLAPLVGCADLLEANASTCSGQGGTLAAPGLVCDGLSGDCLSARAGTSFCCQRLNNTCFEGTDAGGVVCTGGGGTVNPGKACLPTGFCEP
jgi:hypothetical protein